MPFVGDGVLDIPSAARRQFGMRENLPIEVKFSRRVVEDADPYGRLSTLTKTVKKKRKTAVFLLFSVRITQPWRQ